MESSQPPLSDIFTDEGDFVKQIYGFHYIPHALLIAFTLIIVMATLSRPNSHPDEFMHVRGAHYYQTHSLPAEVCDPETLHTYSVYGASRLNSHEISYYVAGKFARIIELVPLSDYLRFRYFNVLLFMFIVIMAYRSSIFRILSIPILLSPQIWYLFSYFNSEAFAIVSTLVIAHQIFDSNSLLRRTLTMPRSKRFAVAVILCGGLFSLLLLIKKSFYFFPLFLGLCAVALLWRFRINSLQSYFRSRASAILVISVAFYGAWVGANEAMNDFDRSAKIADCREQTAKYIYKPSTPIEDSAPTLYRKQKGLPLSSLFEAGWAGVVLRSAFGYYGYFDAPASPLHYNLVKVLFSGFLAYLFISVLVRGDFARRSFIVIAIITFLALFATALWKSWTRDFQPQGRYYFSLIPIIGSLCFACRGFYSGKILSVFILGLYLLSLHSFLFVGLVEIAKAN
ncbi:MAG: hypothetical protein OEQ39_05225 [Gammaproteobacteria bacterium]|nr:hypothetical protein [Gammaproteobacteria bacterium]MDH3465234.1 hypothetical protein [Gammaproteobacteria bacterium]